MLTMDNFLSNGISHKKAAEIVDALETEERAKSAYFKKYFKYKHKSKNGELKKYTRNF